MKTKTKYVVMVHVEKQTESDNDDGIEDIEEVGDMHDVARFDTLEEAERCVGAIQTLGSCG